jgi:hypothetical protein
MFLIALINYLKITSPFHYILGLVYINISIPVPQDPVIHYARFDTCHFQKGILDVRVKTRDGRQINIEIQILPTEFMPERTLFYWSKMYVSQIKAGDTYDQLK